MRGLAVAWLCVLLGCATQPRLVAPLVYVERSPVPPPAVAEGSFPGSPPEVSKATAALECAPAQSFQLENGLRGVVVERHAFPSVSVGLIFAGSTPRTHAAADLLHLQLIGATYLSGGPAAETVRADCDLVGCSVFAWAPAADLRDSLAAVASRVQASGPRSDYERRLSAAMQALRLSGRWIPTLVARNAFALALGEPPMGGLDLQKVNVPLDELDAARRDALTIDRATLVIAGDVTFEEARAAAQATFGSWTTPPSSSEGSPVSVPSQAPSVVLVDVRGTAEAAGYVVVRGPPRDHPDAAAFVVASQILGGGPTSTVIRAVREDLAAAYALGAQVHWLGSTSFVTIGGPLDRFKAIEALGALVQAVRRFRESGALQVDVDRAKAAVISGVRKLTATGPGLTGAVALGIFAGGPDACGFANALASVTVDDVRRIAARYFADADLHVLALGPASEIGPWLSDLRLGAPVKRDGFAHDVP